MNPIDAAAAAAASSSATDVLTVTFDDVAPGAESMHFTIDRKLTSRDSGAAALRFKCRPAPFTRDVISKLAAYVRAFESSSSSSSEQQPLPRVAHSAAHLGGTIGIAAATALLDIFDGGRDEHGHGHGRDDDAMRRGVLAFAMAQQVGLKPLLVDAIVWELARRTRACADKAEVREEFLGAKAAAAAGAAISSAKEVDAVKAAVPPIFEAKAARQAVSSAASDSSDDDGGEEEEEYEERE